MTYPAGSITNPVPTTSEGARVDDATSIAALAVTGGRKSEPGSVIVAVAVGSPGKAATGGCGVTVSPGSIGTGTDRGGDGAASCDEPGTEIPSL